jgi:hypothetical protein
MGIVVRIPRPQTVIPFDEQQPPPHDAKPADPGAYAGLIKAFLTKKIAYEHPLRMRRCSTWRRADLYAQGKQWLRPSYNLDPTRTMHWSEDWYDEDDPDWIPQPVYNEMLTAFSNETARLSKPEYRPYVRPSGDGADARIKEAAKTSTEILTGELEEMSWDTRVADPGYNYMPMYGGWPIASWWDLSWDDTIRVPKLSAMKCPAPGCDFKVASPKLDVEGFKAIEAKVPGRALVDGEPMPPAPAAPAWPGMEQAGPPPLDPKRAYSLDTCLTCSEHEETVTEDAPLFDDIGMPMMDEMGAPMMAPTQRQAMMPGAPKLVPYTPQGAEVHATDSLDQPLGEDKPRGRWWCRTLSPYDLFWENLGIDEELEDWRAITWVHVESLDYARARYPHAAGVLRAEAPEALLQYHPIGGERAIFAGSSGSEAVYRNHLRIKEHHKKPYMEPDGRGGWKVNKGRSMVMGNDVVLLDGPYLMESKRTPGKYVARIHFDYVAWELRSGGREKDGFSMSEMLFDVQDNLNETKSQTQDIRQRKTTPKWLTPRGFHLDYDDQGTGAGSQWIYDPDPENPGIMPQEVGNTTIDAGVYREIEDDREFFARASGHNDVEAGNFPPGVTAASAIQIAAEQAGERRRPRIRRIRKMFERVWRHGLELNHEFVLEDQPRKYKVKDASNANEWRERTWSGADICGQTDVRIDAEPEHDTALTRRENLVSAMNLGIYDPQTATPRQRMLMAKRLDVPKEVTDDEDMQYQAAEREFYDFLDLDRPPVVDPDIDDHVAHKDQHGIDCHSEKWRSLEREAKWDEALLWLWGWDDPAGVDPATGLSATLFDMWKGEAQTKAGAGRAAPIPPALELQILALWGTLLEGSGFMRGLQQPQVKALKKVMRFRAHLAAHSKILKQELMAQQAGMPVAAAPDAPATAAGAKPAPQRGPVQVQ